MTEGAIDSPAFLSAGVHGHREYPIYYSSDGFARYTTDSSRFRFKVGVPIVDLMEDIFKYLEEGGEDIPRGLNIQHIAIYFFSPSFLHWVYLELESTIEEQENKLGIPSGEELYLCPKPSIQAQNSIKKLSSTRSREDLRDVLFHLQYLFRRDQSVLEEFVKAEGIGCLVEKAEEDDDDQLTREWTLIVLEIVVKNHHGRIKVISCQDALKWIYSMINTWDKWKRRALEMLLDLVELKGEVNPADCLCLADAFCKRDEANGCQPWTILMSILKKGVSYSEKDWVLPCLKLINKILDGLRGTSIFSEVITIIEYQGMDTLIQDLGDSKDSTIGDEIKFYQSIGKRDEATRRQKLAEGTVKVARVRINVVGQDGVGKSCLVRLLLGQEFKDLSSTIGIDTSNAKVNIMRSLAANMPGSKTWQLLDRQQVKELLNKHFIHATVDVPEETSPREVRLQEARSTEEFPNSGNMANKPDEGKLKRRHESSLLMDNKEKQKEPDRLPPTGRSGEKTEQRSCSDDRSRHSLDQLKLPKEHLQRIKDIINDQSRVGSQREVILLTICDFGGQEPFLQAHAALMPAGSLSIYMLVFNGAELLTDEATSSHRSRGDDRIADKPQELYRMKTNGDFLKYWATAVHIADTPTSALQSESAAAESQSNEESPFAKQQQEEDSSFPGEAEEVAFPAIILTATHREEAEKTTAESCGMFQNNLQQNEKYIQDAFSGTDCKRHFVKVSSSCKERGYAFPFLYAVENSTSGTDQEDPMAKEIRNTVEKMTSNYWEKQEPQPARWLKFEDVLGELKQITGRSVAELDYVREVAKICEILSDDDLEKVLRHLTNVAAAFHFPEVPDLKEWVIHDVSWLTHVLSSFVGSAHVDPPPNLSRDWDTAYRNGLLSARIVKYLLLAIAKIGEDEFQMAKTVLRHFDVATPYKEDLFCPCFLRSDFQGKTAYSQAFNSPNKSDLPLPLVLYPKDVLSFPEPLFFRLITRLFQFFKEHGSDYQMHLSSYQKRNRFICYGEGIEAEFLYYCTRQESNSGSFVIVTLSSSGKDGKMSKTQFSTVTKMGITLREFLFENVEAAKQRGMAGFQCDFCCQVKEGKVSDDNLADLKDFNGSQKVWLVKSGEKPLGKELKRMKLWFQEEKPSSCPDFLYNLHKIRQKQTTVSR